MTEGLLSRAGNPGETRGRETGHNSEFRAFASVSVVNGYSMRRHFSYCQSMIPCGVCMRQILRCATAIATDCTSVARGDDETILQIRRPILTVAQCPPCRYACLTSTPHDDDSVGNAGGCIQCIRNAYQSLPFSQFGSVHGDAEVPGVIGKNGLRKCWLRTVSQIHTEEAVDHLNLHISRLPESIQQHLRSSHICEMTWSWSPVRERLDRP